MKTIKQWLETIEDKEIRKKALKNMYNEDNIEESLSDAIAGAFVWEDSPERHDFWSNLSRRYEIRY